MIRCFEMAAQVEEVRHGGVDVNESLRLKHGLEPSHSPLPYAGRLMRQLGPIVRVSTGVVRSAWQQRAAGNRVTSQFVCHDRSRLATETREQVPEEAPGGRRVPSLLEQYLDNFTVLIHGTPRVPLPALAPDGDFGLQALVLHFILGLSGEAG